MGNKKVTAEGLFLATLLAVLPYPPTRPLSAWQRQHREDQIHLTPAESGCASPSNPSAASQSWMAEPPLVAVSYLSGASSGVDSVRRRYWNMFL